MKFKISFILLLVSNIFFAQKHYRFDNLLVYKIERIDSLPLTTILLTNSADNSYSVKLTEKDSLTFNVNFHHNLGVFSHSYILKKDLFLAESLSIQCDDIFRYAKRKTKYDYSFSKGDTLIENKKYTAYNYQIKSLKKKKNLEEGDIYFIIEPKTDTHLPILRGDYLDKAKINNVPNGIYREKIVVRDKKVVYKEILQEMHKIKKFIVVPKEFDFSKK